MNELKNSEHYYTYSIGSKVASTVRLYAILIISIACGVCMLMGCTDAQPQPTNEHTPIAQYIYYENDSTILIVAHYVDGIDSIYVKQ